MLIFRLIQVVFRWDKDVKNQDVMNNNYPMLCLSIQNEHLNYTTYPLHFRFLQLKNHIERRHE